MSLFQLLSTIWPNSYAREPYQQQSLLQMYLNSHDFKERTKQSAMRIAEAIHEPDRVAACNRNGFSRR